MALNVVNFLTDGLTTILLVIIITITIDYAFDRMHN